MRRAVGVVAAVGIAGFLVLGIVPAASAATVNTTVDGMQFQADDSDVAAGATLTDYTPGALDVVIPNTVTINTVTYSVTSIGDLAFDGDGLTSVALPSGLSSIGFESFQDNNLTSIALPTGLVSIGPEAFNENDIASLTIPNSLTSIGQSAFLQNELTSLTLGSGLTIIENEAFAYNHLTTVSIPGTVAIIGNNAFISNDLTTINLASGVTSIGLAAFYLNDLTSVTLPATVTSLDNYAFDFNPDLTSFTFEGPAPTTFTPAGAAGSLGTTAGIVVDYLWANGSPQAAGGFTSPTWQGYATQALVTTTFVANGHGAAPDPQTIPSGTAVTEPIAPTATLWTFKGWYTNAALTDPASFTAGLTTDQTLYARWDPTLAVTGEPFDYPALWGGFGAAFAGLVLLLVARRRRLTSPIV